MAELLTEVRALRADLNQAAGASMRMQLLVARLSLQEQRVNTVGRQLTDVNAQLDAAGRARTAVEDRVKNFEGAIAARTVPPEQLHDMENVLLGERGNPRPLQAREQQLRNQAADIAALLADEQNRWADFSNRLDALEQSLPSATGR